MSNLDRFVPEPRLREVDHVDVGVPLERAHAVLSHLDLGRSPLVRALFSLRTLPARLRGNTPAHDALGLDDIGGANTGFHVFVDEPTSFLVGSIGRFWESEIPFRDVPPECFGAFSEPGWGKLAWEIRFEARGDHATRVSVEVRVSAGDEESWQAFRSYFRLIGPFSRFIRRHVLELVVKDLGTPETEELSRTLPCDERVQNAKAQVTHGITIDATPDAIWPWLVQLGCGRGGWYSYDLLDNDGVPSARRIVPEFQTLRVGDELAATPDSAEGFMVEVLEPSRLLFLHGLYDVGAGKRVLPGDPRPSEFLEVGWVFVLEPLDAKTTRLLVRVRVNLEPDRKVLRAFRVHVVHRLMQSRELENIKRRAEGTLSKHADTMRDVGEGVLGALAMIFELGTPFLRGRRSHWGLTHAQAEREYPGDELVADPRWGWTHAIEIDAPPAAVWPWLAQLGQEKAGFYSYQWLENLAGCDIQNADRIRREWQALAVGDSFRLHPNAPPLRVAAVGTGRYFVVTSVLDPMTSDASTGAHPERFIRVSWLFLVEPLDDGRSRFVSRYRVAYGEDVRARLAYGPSLVEPIGFVMDRRMLLGVKERVEGTLAKAS